MSTGANWTDAGSTTTMRDTESLVQVQMRNIGAKFTGCSTSDQCIQIGSIKINLAAILVGDVTYFRDSMFKYTMG